MGCGGSKATAATAPPVSGGGKKDGQREETKKDRNSRNSGPECTSSENKTWIVMGKYTMKMGKEDIMGEGTSSICRKGTNIKTGQQVAIKVYKSSSSKDGPKAEEVKLQKFKRQIQVLQMLQEKFDVPNDPTLWSEQLAAAKPSRLFMSLIDYSKDDSGQPGLDPTDKILYVVTELAQYSLKDYLALRRDQSRPLPKESVRNITKAIMLVVAGLHAKGLVHIDLKPENLMMFDGRLKLIDVDGCVKIGTSVSIHDSSISFSPCYCAPEWAKFLIEESESKICVQPSLDVWSVGMTICELVTLDAILKPMYANFLRNGHSHREAGFLFMEWLSSVRKAPLPKAIERYQDEEFVKLLTECLLVTDPKNRKSLAMSLGHSYVNRGPSKSSAGGEAKDDAKLVDANEKVKHRTERMEDTTSVNVIVHKGTLWKLNNNANPRDKEAWLQRDMWIAGNGSLCYFSIKDNKRLVLLDSKKLNDAEMKEFTGGARENAFQLDVPADKEDGTTERTYFACASPEEKDEWMVKLKQACKMDAMPRFQLGEAMAADLKVFRLNVKNRRMKVDESQLDQFAPIFKAVLWKVKAEGNRMKAEDWFEREMWLSKNNSLVYYSKKEERDLVYYTTEDLAAATYIRLDNAQSVKPWAFQVQLPTSGGVEFAPGEFAAENQEMREKWLDMFAKVKKSS